jgi:hypothetical protein
MSRAYLLPGTVRLRNSQRLQAIRYLYRSIRESPKLSRVYDNEVSCFRYRGDFERRLVERRCMTWLKQEVSALQKQGASIDVFAGREDQSTRQIWVDSTAAHHHGGQRKNLHLQRLLA